MLELFTELKTNIVDSDLLLNHQLGAYSDLSMGSKAIKTLPNIIRPIVFSVRGKFKDWDEYKKSNGQLARGKYLNDNIKYCLDSFLMIDRELFPGDGIVPLKSQNGGIKYESAYTTFNDEEVSKAYHTGAGKSNYIIDEILNKLNFNQSSKYFSPLLNPSKIPSSKTRSPINLTPVPIYIQ